MSRNASILREAIRDTGESFCKAYYPLSLLEFEMFRTMKRLAKNPKLDEAEGGYVRTAINECIVVRFKGWLRNSTNADDDCVEKMGYYYREYLTSANKGEYGLDCGSVIDVFLASTVRFIGVYIDDRDAPVVTIAGDFE